jgi:peroxiredoxin
MTKRSRPRYNAGHSNEEVSMIAIGENAPDFNLKDQFGRDITLGQFKGRRHVMLLFYPLDFTPT